MNKSSSFLEFMNQLLILCLLFLFSFSAFAQNDSLRNRKKIIAYSYSTVYTASAVGFYQLWYKDYQQESFHFFNDNNQWLLMDKLGHGFSAYALTKYSTKSYEWAGIEEKKAGLYGALTSIVFLGTIEIFDGFSSEWGFSWGDMLANVAGSALSYGQNRFLEEEIIKLKYSYTPTKYRKIRPEVLGNNELEGMFKDYNGQTYWASINLNAISKEIKPRWLSFAIGYSGDKMLRGSGAYQDENGTVYSPQRQYYLSLDVDLEKIETQNRFFKSMLSVFNIIKFPLPAIEFQENGKAQFYYLYF